MRQALAIFFVKHLATLLVLYLKTPALSCVTDNVI